MDFSNYLTDVVRTGTRYWQYTFPNGHVASVIPDPHDDRPFRFEIESTDPEDVGSGGILTDLTTGEVEAKLAKLAGLDQNENAR